jgi:hypothetical protein
MRKRQKAVDLTENRKRAPVARRQILRPKSQLKKPQICIKPGISSIDSLKPFLSGFRESIEEIPGLMHI